MQNYDKVTTGVEIGWSVNLGTSRNLSDFDLIKNEKKFSSLNAFSNI